MLLSSEPDSFGVYRVKVGSSGTALSSETDDADESRQKRQRIPVLEELDDEPDEEEELLDEEEEPRRVRSRSDCRTFRTRLVLPDLTELSDSLRLCLL